MGVGTGVFCEEDTAVPDKPVCLGGPISPVYTCPNSPGKKDNVEQKPSDEEINSVKPSLDLSSELAAYPREIKKSDKNTHQVKSVNVAQCRLLTTHIGVCCWVSYNSTESWVATAYTIR